MAWQGRAPALHRKLEAFAEPCPYLGNAESIDTARHNLDGKRDAIEPSANVRDERRVGILELECTETGRCTVDEELN